MNDLQEWQDDPRKAFAGLIEAFARAVASLDAQEQREGEEDYLPYDTAWECAAVEYTWRGRHKCMGDAYEAEAARAYEWMWKERTALGDRDGYKALWEERGRQLTYVNDVVSKTLVKERDAARSTLDTYEAANRELSKDREALRTLLTEVLSHFPAPHWTKGGTDGLVSSGSVLWSTLAKWRATVAEPATEGPDVFTVPTVGVGGRQAWLVCTRKDSVTVGRIERVRPDGFRAYVDHVSDLSIGVCVGWSADMAGALREIRRNLG